MIMAGFLLQALFFFFFFFCVLWNSNQIAGEPFGSDAEHVISSDASPVAADEVF